MEIVSSREDQCYIPLARTRHCDPYYDSMHKVEKTSVSAEKRDASCTDAALQARGIRRQSLVVTNRWHRLRISARVQMNAR